MGSEVEITVDEVTWFAGHGPRAVVGPCDHPCRHAVQSVIAWGPDHRHYELVRCDDVCGGRCRAWVADHPPETGEGRSVGTWRRVGSPR